MMPGYVKLLFYVDVVLNLVMLTGVVWSVASPAKRIWPPPRRESWQYRLTWVCFILVFSLNAALFFLDWDSWMIGNSERFLILFTRNPQYLGDMVLFLGLSIVANSLVLWIAHILLIMVFAITPLAEETWLEGQYGEGYLQYKREVPRSL